MLVDSEGQADTTQPEFWVQNWVGFGRTTLE